MVLHSSVGFHLFVGKVRSLLYRGAPERCFTQVGYGRTFEHETRPVRSAKNKHSSLSAP